MDLPRSQILYCQFPTLKERIKLSLAVVLSSMANQCQVLGPEILDSGKINFAKKKKWQS